MIVNILLDLPANGLASGFDKLLSFDLALWCPYPTIPVVVPYGWHLLSPQMQGIGLTEGIRGEMQSELAKSLKGQLFPALIVSY